jgi:hypothetical protein
MTLIEAMEIKAAFTGAMTFAGYGGKSRREALAEPAEKYSEQQLAEAYAILTRQLDYEQEVLRAMFVVAIKSKKNGKDGK